MKPTNSALILLLSLPIWCALAAPSNAQAKPMVVKNGNSTANRTPVPKPACADPNFCAIPMEKGDAAPYAGQLLTPDLAIRLGQVAHGCDERRTALYEKCRAESDIDLERERALRKDEKATMTGQLDALQKQLEHAQQLALDATPPFYAQPWFVAPVTAILTGTALVWALHH